MLINKIYAQEGIVNPVAPHFTLGGLISGLIGVIIIIAFIISFFFLLWGGVQWIVAGGEQGQVEAARSRIVNAIVGLTLVVAAWSIMTIVGTIFHIEFTKLPLPTLGGHGSSPPGRGGTQCYQTAQECLQACAPSKIQECINQCGADLSCWQTACGVSNSFVCFQQCKNGVTNSCINCINANVDLIVTDFCVQNCGSTGNDWQCK